MKGNHSPSVNIIRDDNVSLNYFVTPNAEKTATTLFQNFERGTHAFNLIGSFGTGKSAFFWALEKSLKGESEFFKTPYNGKTDFVKIIGDYGSLEAALNEEFGVTEDFSSNQKLFDAIYKRYQETIAINGLLVIAIDEFGKFLEYAAKNNPEDEIYFIQKLAEFANAPNRNILLLTSIHQSFESYGFQLNEKEINEWKKVTGRFQDLTFNEPIEQLLFLAASFLSQRKISKNEKEGNSQLIKKFNIYNVHSDYLERTQSKLHPLSAVSGYSLAIALQRYGQNERSLFTFLKSIKFTEISENDSSFELPDVYDYLYSEFYNFLISKSNPDYSNWSAIRNALERAETIFNLDVSVSHDILKTLGLLTIFSKKGSTLNAAFFTEYFKDTYSDKLLKEVIEGLRKAKIIRFSNFDSSYKFTEGTDLDIEKAILDAERKIDSSIDVLSRLNSHFDFPVITAKSISYRFGTPRIFEFLLTNDPTEEIATGEIDGYINLVFNDIKDFKGEDLKQFSRNKPTLFGLFKNTAEIFQILFEIEKTKKVLKDMEGEKDRVAIKELQTIIKSHENLLNHFVMDSLYSNKVIWFANGQDVQVRSKKEFNHLLSTLCGEIYSDTPILKNELFNKHKVSGAISSARRNFWRALANDYQKEDLGFDENKWPAEKTIYYTLLKETGIHRKRNDNWDLGAPTVESFDRLWEVSNRFLDEAKTSKKSLVSFMEALEKAPLKLKHGVIEFWAPTFLYINRGDFALYGDQGFVPHIDENTLYMMNRNPKEFYIKSFELNNLRLNLFNKYRDFLKQENKSVLDTDSFIESIRPLLIFYRDLTDYGKSTKTISREAIKLRESISKAKDPEQTFFEDFPQALGYSLNDLASNNELFEEYIIDFQNTIQEIKNSFSELLDRLEIFITKEIVNKEVSFPTYKNILQNRFSAVKEHETLAKHKSFLWRINSNLEDRDSFLMSIGQALLGKSLNKIKDSDEKLLKEKLILISKELDNLVDLSKVSTNDNEELYKLDLTTKNKGGITQIVRLPKDKLEDMEVILNKLSKELDSHKNLKMPILVSLLQRELNKNE
ncbi:hypothetical protein FK178_13320 [Antarcticibacterium arcticum]|uniref:ATP-binding protein n=1 Tax=Antarcticibacterium arcticum TaxID=2585771 RepID=A0A5B8YPR6_9FLAO|nr:hypothetical protein [Antarcticibacterium arcticum]QED38633.1 hypothetical protein FK178_13320 [Antarcticibacterium arcticum]